MLDCHFDGGTICYCERIYDYERDRSGHILTLGSTSVTTPLRKERLPFHLWRRQGRNRSFKGSHESDDVGPNKRTMVRSAALRVEALDERPQFAARPVCMGQHNATEARPVIRQHADTQLSVVLSTLEDPQIGRKTRGPNVARWTQFCLRCMCCIGVYVVWISLFAQAIIGLSGAFDLGR